MDDESPTNDHLVETTPTRTPSFDDGPGGVLTPMGQVDSAGAFARGLGARRLRIVLAIGGGLMLLLALLTKLQ